ncbi:leucine-rich repeat-containing protein 15-like [Chironomus tepperi]|uniref:leucine-rich repeat-containing protein 15-like n=1 Tax=Chironomus tepperi TaxID=113505 RepID=UPI00391F211E
MTQNSIIPSLILSILFLISTIPSPSTQQSIINMPSLTPASCDYKHDLQNRYSCYITNLTAIMSEPLHIVGTHLPGYTDDDVLAVYHVNCRMNRFNGEVMNKFANLRILNLRRTHLHLISPIAFDRCDNLEELNIEGNSVTSLVPLLLQNCVNFKNLHAFNNRIANIPENLFGSTRSLEVFDIHRNRLPSVPGNLFQNMTNLRMFDIGSNYISELSPNILLNAVNLEYIDISRNNFDDQQTVMQLLTGHLALRNIQMFSNLFPMFSFNFFTQFNRLDNLAVGGLGNSSNIAWQALPASLRLLSTYGIGEEIPANAFNRLTSLTTLDISGTGITVLHKDTFKALTNLEWLFIMYTSIKTIHPELFISQGNLQILFLNWNEIEEIPAGALAPLVNLGYNTSEFGLHFFGNKLQRLSSSSFGQHPHLDYIDFSFNEIMEIDRGIFSRFSPTVSFFGLRFNNCTHTAFYNASNLDQDSEEMLWCFYNYEGMETTTPNGVGGSFRGFRVFVLIFVGILSVF